MRLTRTFTAVLLALVLLCGIAYASGNVKMTNFQSVLDYVTAAQPAEFDLGDTEFTPSQLRRIRDALPEGAAFSFRVKFCNTWICSTDTVIDLDINSKRTKITQADVENLLYLMPQVTVFNKFNAGLGNDVMIALTEAYPSVTFGWTVRLSANFNVRSDATAYSQNKHLDDEHLHSGTFAKYLKYVPGLKAIDLGHNYIDDISFLTAFPDTTVLILADNDISDISPLACMTQMEYLELFMNDISDLTPLAGLTRLKDLNLCRCKLKDVDLSVLDGLTELERFWCTQSGVSKEMQQAFENAHPNCECNWDIGSCTDNGWRQHTRYYQYRDMFKTGIWMPFVSAEEFGR